MNIFSPFDSFIHSLDFYKTDHRRQYPYKTTVIASNATGRSFKLFKGVDSPHFDGKLAVFGIQGVLRDMVDFADRTFFKCPIDKIVEDYKEMMSSCIGSEDFDTTHIQDLHRLGYLPLQFCSLDEGTAIPENVPYFLYKNTHPQFFWLTNYLETYLSSEIWLAINNGTIARYFRMVFDAYAKKTGVDPSFVDFMGHDFSFRGMPTRHAAMISGAAHLMFFRGTDTIPAIRYLKHFYPGSNSLLGTSVPATEHSVMCVDGSSGEFETFKRLITETYPKGIVSIVSDTFNLWKVLNEYLPALKDIILKREGKVVIRPDSGDPNLILNGDPTAFDPAARAGVVRKLAEIFGTETIAGYRHLNPHIGVIYGDGIGFHNIIPILDGMVANGMAVNSCVYGLGSFTYQYSTRDTLGQAIKATYSVVDGKERAVFKDPATGKSKKSRKGLLVVYQDDKGQIQVKEEATIKEFYALNNLLKIRFWNGSFNSNPVSYEDVRKRFGFITK